MKIVGFLDKDAPKVRLLWLSRHKPFPEQIDELNDHFENLEIIIHPYPVRTGEEVAELMQDYQCSELFAVLPTNLIEEVLELNIKPIKAQMHRTLTPDGALFVHDYFYRITKMDVVRELL